MLSVAGGVAGEFPEHPMNNEENNTSAIKPISLDIMVSLQLHNILYRKYYVKCDSGALSVSCDSGALLWVKNKQCAGVASNGNQCAGVAFYENH
jgi:hypothetical protein